MTKHDKPRDLVHGATPSATPPTATRIYIAPGRLHRTRGRTYNALLGSPDGELIVSNALDVEYAACRALKARGIDAVVCNLAYKDIVQKVMEQVARDTVGVALPVSVKGH
jgi:hypothetical protein